MFTPRSFNASLATFFAGFSLIVANAQSVLPMTIVNISTNTVVDLYKMYNGDGIVDPGPTLFLWDYDNSNGPIARAFSTFDESIEIISGSAEAAGNTVVDIAAVHVIYSTANYFFPASVPLGLYHARINSTVNTTTSTGGFNIQQLTARSPTINVTTSFPIGCGSKVPPPFTNVPSPNVSDFTSLYVFHPSAGYNVARDSSNPADSMNIQWDYRDARNTLNAGITGISAQIMDSGTSSPIGPAQKVEIAGETDGLIAVKFSDVPMQVGGSYKIQMTYQNNVQDGTVSAGNQVTFTSEPFNVVLSADQVNDCAANSPGSNPGSSSTSSGKASGAPKSVSGEISFLFLLGLLALALV